MRHIVRPVAQVSQGEPGQSTVPLSDGLQVGEHLAGMKLVGEGVDHRHPRDTSHRLDTALRVGPPYHGVGVAGQYPRGVLDGLLAT